MNAREHRPWVQLYAPQQLAAFDSGDRDIAEVAASVARDDPGALGTMPESVAAPLRELMLKALEVVANGGRTTPAYTRPDVDPDPRGADSSTPDEQLLAAYAASMDRVCDVIAERVHWLMPGFIPLGFVTLFEGDAKRGKTTVIYDVAARVTRGWQMPNEHAPGTEPKVVREPRAVLVYSTEDPVATVGKARLRACGADDRLVFQQKQGHDLALDTLGPEGIETMRRQIAAAELVCGVPVGLVVLDPLSGYFGGAANDFNSDPAVRKTMKPLAALADELGISIVAVRHNVKARTGSAQRQGGGSVAIGASARSIIQIGTDPNDGDRLVMASTACNLTPKGVPSLGFAFREASVSMEVRDRRSGEVEMGTIEVGAVDWFGPVQVGADDLVTDGGDELGAMDEAVAWLQSNINEDTQFMSATDALTLSKKEGISDRTLKRAKSKLGIKSSPKDGKWFWHLPGVKP